MCLFFGPSRALHAAEPNVGGLANLVADEVHHRKLGPRHVDVVEEGPLTNSGKKPSRDQKAVGQNQWYHFGVGAPPILVCFSGDWDVHWGYGLLTHGQKTTLRSSGILVGIWYRRSINPPYSEWGCPRVPPFQ